MNTLSQIKENIQKVMIGQDKAIELILISLAAGGHVLLEDLPGTGKTVLAKSLAKSMDVQYSRIQFTPDLLPSDVTGLNYFNQEKGEFVFREGPVDEGEDLPVASGPSLTVIVPAVCVLIPGRTDRLIIGLYAVGWIIPPFLREA